MKAYQLKKAKDVSKDLEDLLLGSYDPPSSTPASSATNSASTEKSPMVDPLQLILERLDSMQGHLAVLQNKGVLCLHISLINSLLEGRKRLKTIVHTSSHWPRSEICKTFLYQKSFQRLHPRFWDRKIERRRLQYFQWCFLQWKKLTIDGQN